MRCVAIEQRCTSKGKAAFSGASGQRDGNSASDAMAPCRARNHRMPASPACSDSNQSRIASASFSAAAVVSTRKVMLAPQIGEKFGGRSGAPGSYILVPLTDAVGGFCEVLAFPLKVGCQSIVESRGRVLSAPFGVFLQLRLTLRFEWDHIHVGLSFLPFIVRGSAAEVKSYLLVPAPTHIVSPCRG